jgi:hypothetical protein
MITFFAAFNMAVGAMCVIVMVGIVGEFRG